MVGEVEGEHEASSNHLLLCHKILPKLRSLKNVSYFIVSYVGLLREGLSWPITLLRAAPAVIDIPQASGLALGSSLFSLTSVP